MTIDSSLLDPGERAVWSGKPNPTAYAFRKGRYTFLIGIPFFAFSIFWISMAASGEGKAPPQMPFPFWLFGIPFVLVGAGMLLSPIWYFVRGARATYALTNRRALIDISGMFGRRFSVPLDQIRFIELRESGSGTGDVLFHETMVSSSNNYMPRRDGFVAVPDARRVEQLLRTTMEKAASARGDTAR